MFRWLKLLFGAKTQYLTFLTKDQETKDKSTKLGVQGIILSVIGVVAVISLVLLATNLADNVLATQRGEGYQMPVMSLLGAIVFYAFAFVVLCNSYLVECRFRNIKRKSTSVNSARSL